jgi:hypothetical protein
MSVKRNVLRALAGPARRSATAPAATPAWAISRRAPRRSNSERAVASSRSEPSVSPTASSAAARTRRSRAISYGAPTPRQAAIAHAAREPHPRAHRPRVRRGRWHRVRELALPVCRGSPGFGAAPQRHGGRPAHVRRRWRCRPAQEAAVLGPTRPPSLRPRGRWRSPPLGRRLVRDGSTRGPAAASGHSRAHHGGLLRPRRGRPSAAGSRRSRRTRRTTAVQRGIATAPGSPARVPGRRAPSRHQARRSRLGGRGTPRGSRPPRCVRTSVRSPRSTRSPARSR